MRDEHKSQFDIFLTLSTVTLIIFFDRITKDFFSEALLLGESIPVIRNILHMTLVHNTGIAFWLFKNQGIVFIIIPAIAIALLVFNIYYYQQNHYALCRT